MKGSQQLNERPIADSYEYPEILRRLQRDDKAMQNTLKNAMDGMNYVFKLNEVLGKEGIYKKGRGRGVEGFRQNEI